jgi:hypothetical protein
VGNPHFFYPLRIGLDPRQGFENDSISLNWTKTLLLTVCPEGRARPRYWKWTFIIAMTTIKSCSGARPDSGLQRLPRGQEPSLMTATTLAVAF